MVRAAEAAVYNNQPAVALQRAFAFLCLNGDVAVYYAAPRLIAAEGVQYLSAELLFVRIAVIMVFGFLPCCLVLNKRALKRGNMVAAEHGRISSAPKVPKIVAPFLAFLAALRRKQALPRKAVGIIKIRLAGKRYGLADFKFHEAAVPVAGHAPMEKQIAVAL